MEALKDFSLDVGRNEFVVLLGPSGCGKSTLLYLIAGLEDLTAGTIEGHGVPVSEPDSDRSLIFQESSLYPWLSVVGNVTFGLKLRGVSKAQRREIARELLNEVGLGGFEDKRPDELSGGMRQRAAVARALAMKPSVLLMDEPFAALDVQTRSKLQDFLIKIWRDSGASVLFVTHHIDEAMALADRVVVFTGAPRHHQEHRADQPAPAPRPARPEASRAPRPSHRSPGRRGRSCLRRAGADLGHGQDPGLARGQTVPRRVGRNSGSIGALSRRRRRNTCGEQPCRRR